MKRVIPWVGALALVLAAIVIAEIPPVKEAAQLIDAHRRAALGATLGLAGVGFVVFMGGILSMVMASGRSMSHEEVEAAISHRRGRGQPGVWRGAAHRVVGNVAGRQASSEVSFSEVKEAWRTGAWRRDSHWRRFFTIAAGALLLSYGIAGVMTAIGPAHVKVLMAGTMTYVTVMTVRGFARA